jgi:arylsulfatase A-like enzyme
LLLPIAPGIAQTANPATAPKANGRTPEQSPPPSWPQEPRAPRGAPNVLVIMTDDVGFGASSSFGGPIPTPTFDALSREGLRYNRFHTTAICSPTRASLLTGRNPQEVGVGYTTNWPTGYEGYNSVIPKSAGTVAQILKEGGYDTAMFGKGHITPEWEMSQAGPFDRWPTGLGFEYYYGFLGADTSPFEPSLVENTRPVRAPTEQPGYHLDRDLADHAIRWIAEQHAAAPDKPFFVYYASGSAHAPNLAPAAWLARFRGKFDQGWDALRATTVARQKALGVIPADTEDTPRPATLPRWDSLSPDEKRLYARYMEAYAASLAYADDQIGRVIQSLRDSGEIDNTLIIYIQGDNGSSAEGSFNGKLYEQSALSGVTESQAYNLAHIDEIGSKAAYNLYPGGWGWALNAPFQWAKRYGSHFGGLRNAMVLSWPHHIKDPGGLRSQFLHVSDIMPTVLDVAGIKAPAVLDGVSQQPVTGISARYTIDAPNAPSRRTSQVFAMAENLSLYQDGWVAATTPMVTPWERTPPLRIPVEQRRWELYNVAADFSEAHDLASSEPQRLERMKRQFWVEAAKAGILPIHASEGHQEGRPDLNHGRETFTYGTPMVQIPETAAPPIVGRSFEMVADIVIPAGGGHGVLAAQGGRFGGFSLFFDQHRPAFTYNLTPAHVTRLDAPQPIGAGAHRVAVRFQLDKDVATSGGSVVLLVDDVEVARTRVERTFKQVISHTEGFDVGSDEVSAVDGRYTVADSRFNGTIRQLKVTLMPMR